MTTSIKAKLIKSDKQKNENYNTIKNLKKKSISTISFSINIFRFFFHWRIYFFILKIFFYLAINLIFIDLSVCPFNKFPYNFVSIIIHYILIILFWHSTNFVCSNVSELRFYGCCHPCFISITNKLRFFSATDGRTDGPILHVENVCLQSRKGGDIGL